MNVFIFVIGLLLCFGLVALGTSKVAISGAFIFWLICLFVTILYTALSIESIRIEFIKNQKNYKIASTRIVVIVCMLFIIFTVFVIQYDQNYDKCNYSPHSERDYCY